MRNKAVRASVLVLVRMAQKEHFLVSPPIRGRMAHIALALGLEPPPETAGWGQAGGFLMLLPLESIQ